MRSPLILLCALFSLVACTTAQLPEGAIELPKKIDETSGLASFGDYFLTFNDSGGKATLYPFNKKGERLGKYKIEGAINRDWEDIAQDSTHFYIADTGNNYATRKDLTIYIVNQAFKLEDSIRVNYASQTKFEKKKKNKYDAETLIAYGDSLLIFSKNRKSRKTQLYAFPKKAGSYSLEKLRSFEVNALITGGDYDAASRRLILTGYLPDYTQYIFKAENFQLKQLEEVVLERYQLPLSPAQIEAVKILEDGSVWITSEGEGVNLPYLYEVDFNLLSPTT